MRKIISLFFLVALVLFLNSELQGADWKVYAHTDEGNAYHYDKQSITRTADNHVCVWIKIIFSDEGIREVISKLGEKYNNISDTIFYYKVDCTEKKWKLLSGTDYSKDGKVISSSDNDTKWSFIIPDSMMNALYEKVCK
jgi:hypothetical protein